MKMGEKRNKGARKKNTFFLNKAQRMGKNPIPSKVKILESSNLNSAPKAALIVILKNVITTNY